MLQIIKNAARKLKLDLCAVYLASRDERTPTTAKCVAILVAAYALSPIDLIPDFIPILGYLDDLILVPAGLALVIKLIPKQLMDSFRQDATHMALPSANWIVATIIIVLWSLLLITAGWWLYTQLH